MGSGAGFPGIPLALWLDKIKVTLIERSKRRAGFLRNVSRLLDLDSVEILEKPVEEAASHGPFDVITFRAWTALDKSVLDTLFPLLKEGGAIVAYKGQRETLETELAGIVSLCKVKVFPVRVPGLDAQRCLVVIQR